MLFYPTEKLAIMVDGPNLYGASKSLQFDIDYKRLLELFAKKGTLIRAFYYTAVGDSDEFQPMRPLVDWLGYNGWKMVTKAAREFTDSQGKRRMRGNMAVDLAVDALDMVGHVDHLVIFSGDGDFVPLVAALQRSGCRVSVCSTIKSMPPICADDLRRVADNFIDLAELQLQIARQPKGTP